MSVWPTIERFLSEQGAAALVTLAQTRGSSPREPGARMVVRPDGGFTGTIGGGALEWAALAEAQAMLARRDGPPLQRLDKVLGPDLGQCCGGRVTVTIERFGAADRDAVAALAAAERAGPFTTIAINEGGRLLRRPASPADAAAPLAPGYARLADGRILERFGSDMTALYLFGAGHVGRSLVLALAPLPFRVTWVDPRPGAFPPHIPANAAAMTEASPVQLLDQAPDGAFVAVMTHSHPLDLDLVAVALKADRFGYVGLIGSATKRARFASTLRKLGLAESAIERLVCPIGVPGVHDKAPAVIAAATAAQLLIARDAARAASGHGATATWPQPSRGRHA